jgi:hypothetical protein
MTPIIRQCGTHHQQSEQYEQHQRNQLAYPCQPPTPAPGDTSVIAEFARPRQSAAAIDQIAVPSRQTHQQLPDSQRGSNVESQKLASLPPNLDFERRHPIATRQQHHAKASKAIEKHQQHACKQRWPERWQHNRRPPTPRRANRLCYSLITPCNP